MPERRTHLAAAAEWITSFRLEDAPADVVTLATQQVANIVAAILAGSRSAAGQRVRRASLRTATGGPCTLIPHGDQVSLWDALYLHSCYANALELDDFHYRGHVGIAVVTAPLALAEALGRDGRALLEAQIVASEVAGRVGWVITAELRHGHQRSYLLRLAAAAAAARLLGLDRSSTTSALAISMTQPEVPLHPGMYSPDTKVLSAATSVVEGVRAAYLAAEGVTAARDILEHPAGFYRQFTLQRRVPNPFVQFGEAWCMHALCFKRYSACGYAAGAVDAACEVHRNPGFDSQAIVRIEVATTYPALVLDHLAEPHEAGVLTPSNVQFSIVRCVAAALHLGDLRGYHFAAGAFDRLVPVVSRLAAVSTLVHDWGFTVAQLDGIDDGLSRGGGRESADMIEFHRTARAFRSMFGSARAIGAKDILRLLRLPADQRASFARRWWRSLSSRFETSPAIVPGDYRPLGDLRQMRWRMCGRVTVDQSDGTRLVAEQILPSWMAGDPARGEMVQEKLLAEGEPVIGREAAQRVWQAIASLPETARVRIATLAACGVPAGEDRPA